MTVKEQFLNDIQEAIQEDNRGLLEVYIEMPGMRGREKITNSFMNFQAKHDYYEKAYDDDLHLKANSNIFITFYEVGGKKVEVTE